MSKIGPVNRRKHRSAKALAGVRSDGSPANEARAAETQFKSFRCHFVEATGNKGKMATTVKKRRGRTQPDECRANGHSFRFLSDSFLDCIFKDFQRYEMKRMGR
ncbi:hypothetical protein pdul_cds_854 [Pandoravirus dulcis]|uniref:Uncharacterized protein n=1 Tax=Pandoravirus dulcis TaxID=1349409 RepID=A0A291AUD2_9VIRU|nr:hypothetical protein pdul_cds_854 [Pandoravirus dulcis]ATE82555.1 hypothetical protein pdul_cds_854 [Pandoravirus dulcis]